MTTLGKSTINSRAQYANNTSFTARLTSLGELAPKYSVVLILLWIGAMKFTTYEAAAIEGLVASSPLTSWLTNFLSVQGTAKLVGTIEIATALALVLSSLNRYIAIAGAGAAVATFATTSSFLLTAPGWEASLGGFPSLSVLPGQFLLKDLVLLAVSLSLLAKALKERN